MKNELQFSPSFKSRVNRWARGEITWAQVEGLSAEKAKEFQKTACDLARRGQLKKAKVILEGLVALNPKDHVSRAALGTVLQKLGQVDEARAAYDTAIATSDKDVVAFANRGELRIKAGDVAGGLGDLKRAVESDPKLNSASARRAKALATAIIVQAAKAGNSGSP